MEVEACDSSKPFSLHLRALGLAEIGYLPLVLSLITAEKKEGGRAIHPIPTCLCYYPQSTPLLTQNARLEVKNNFSDQQVIILLIKLSCGMYGTVELLASCMVVFMSNVTASLCGGVQKSHY